MRVEQRKVRCAVVAQVFNLPLRRFAIGRLSERRGIGGLQIRDTAECNSALQQWARLAFEISGLERRRRTQTVAMQNRGWKNPLP
jgi:hypothetical protein